MQITSNTTGMLADLTVSTDKDGRVYCVVVIKGTFVVYQNGTVAIADDQQALVYADEHYGDPGHTSIRYECDFAPFKPKTDVVVNGFAFSPNGSPVRAMRVGFQIGSVRKLITVFGDRFWDGGLVGLRPSDPKPFIQMPLNYERAYGGSDQSHEDPAQWGSELRNPVGVGFYMHARGVPGKPLPNLEDAQHAISSWSDKPPPVSLGGLGRGWQPRIKYAGTYDQQWLEHRFPFLPADFDQRYFQSAPRDQQLPYLTGGEVVRCANMTPDGEVTFVVPRIEIPVSYHFRVQSVVTEPRLDTLIVEPDRRRFIAAWRTATELGRKVHELREVTIGHPQPVVPRRTATGKLHFSSINEAVAWHKTQGR
jgi:hypothetical protein